MALTVGRHRSRRLVSVLVGVVVMAPLGPVALQAVADEWHGPAVWPQRLGWRGVRAVFDDPLVPQALGNSAVVAVGVVLVALVAGWPAARAIAASDRRTRVVLLSVVVAPVLLPPLATGEGLATWLIRLGWGDRLVGVGTAHLVQVVPYVVIGLVPAFTRGLAATEEAAMAFGASASLRLRSVTLPACLPFLAVALALGLAVSWSQYATSLATGGGIPFLPLVLVPFVRSDPQIAAVLNLVFLLPTLALVGLAVSVRPRGDADHPRRRTSR